MHRLLNVYSCTYVTVHTITVWIFNIFVSHMMTVQQSKYAVWKTSEGLNLVCVTAQLIHFDCNIFTTKHNKNCSETDPSKMEHFSLSITHSTVNTERYDRWLWLLNSYTLTVIYLPPNTIKTVQKLIPPRAFYHFASMEHFSLLITH
jgi:hypothetical protein